MYRLVLDLDNQKYFAETSDDRFFMPGEPESEEQIAKRLEREKQDDEEAKKKNDLAVSSGDDTAKYMPQEFRPRRAQFAAFKDASLKPVSLKKSKIALVFTPRLTDAITKGRAYIYFFPLGQTEAADIQVSDSAGETFYSLLVHPMTGRVRIESGAVPPPLPREITDDTGQATP
jgi:general secretion pathway protein H